jgi:hypothetical protein
VHKLEVPRPGCMHRKSPNSDLERLNRVQYTKNSFSNQTTRRPRTRTQIWQTDGDLLYHMNRSKTNADKRAKGLPFFPLQAYAAEESNGVGQHPAVSCLHTPFLFRGREYLPEPAQDKLGLPKPFLALERVP